MLILTGVLGGMISFGIMGIFVGPVILAVTYVLFPEWVNAQPDAEVTAAAAAGSGSGGSE